MSRPITLILALLMLVLSACGGGQATEPDGAAAPAGGPGGTATAGVPDRIATAAATLAPAPTVTAVGEAPAPTAAGTTAIPAPTAPTAPATTATAEGTDGTGGAYPLTYADASGAKVTLEERPERIVSLFPVNNNTLFAIGAGDQVIAVDKEFTTLPPAADEKQRVSCNYTSCAVERIVALKPDLVLTSTGTEQLADKPLRSAGIKVISMPYPSSLQAAYKHMEDLGRITGRRAEAGRAVGNIKREIEQVRRQAARADEVSVYFETDASTPGKPFTVGPGSLLDELITAAGGRNVFGAAKTSAPQVGYEVIVRANPEVMLLGDVKGFVSPSFFNPTTVAEVKRRKGFDTIQAVKQNRVVPINAEVFTVPGPGLGRGLRQLAAAVHPEIFGER